MMRGPIIHAVLLVVALVLSYRAWTEEETVEPKTGDVKVWTESPDAISAVLYETKDRTVRVERRTTDGGDSYLWGIETRVTKVRKPRKPNEPPSDEPPEIKTTVREFPIGERGQEAVNNLARLRALRDLGELDEEQKKKFELLDSTDNITVALANGERSLILGGRVYGGADRYILDTQSGKGYAVAGSVISPLHSGETGLNLRKIHGFEKDEAGKVHMVAQAVGGKELDLVRTETETEHGKKKGWARADSPDKPDQTIANLLNRIETVRPSQYFEEIEQPEALSQLLTVTYKNSAGKEIGTFELYKHVVQPEPEPASDQPAEGDDAAPGADGKAADNDGKAAEGNDGKAAEGNDGKAAEGNDGKAAEGNDGKPEKPAADDKPPEPTVTFYIKTERTRIYGRIGKSLGNLIEKDLEQLLSE
jgi:hypothetical protein